MGTVGREKRTWIVVGAVCLVALAALAVAGELNSSYLDPIGGLAFAAIGLVFCWAYSTDQERLWWAIIPGVGAMTLLAAALADVFIGTDPANDWVSGFVLGLGAAITAAILPRADAKTALIFVAMFSLLVGIAMAPLLLLLKVLLIAADVVVAVCIVWRVRRGPKSPQGA